MTVRGLRRLRARGVMVLAWATVMACPLRAQPVRHRLQAFVVAHADDWQLFMGDVVVDALRRGDPVLVVMTNAGDAARGNEFWRTREVAALASMRAAQELAAIPSPTPLCTTVRIAVRSVALHRSAGTHAVRQCHTASMSTVFLRLPDGKPDGSGYAVHAFRSLRKLADSTIARLDAIDSSASYTGLDDLGATVGGIIREHQRIGLTVHVHTSDPEVLTNPIDHADHRVTGLAALDAARSLRAPVTLYSGYSNVHRADNLRPEAAAWKGYCFVAYDRAMMMSHGGWSAYAENAWAHAQYLSRTYARDFSTTGLLRLALP